MKYDNLYTGSETINRLEAGIRKVAKAVGATMGSSGSNAVIEMIESPGHIMSNDGFSIANSIRLADPIEEMGRKILVESINRANKASGDGSSTTCVLTAAIIEEGRKRIGEASPMDIKRQLEGCIPLIEASIKKQTRVIEPNEVGKVATISAEDEGIGQTIQEIYEKIGKDGIIHWDISKTTSDTYTVGHGITLNAGWLSPYMCDVGDSGSNTNQIRLKSPYILLSKQKIASAADFNDIGAALHAKGATDVVVFCDDIDPLVVPDLILTRMKRGFRFIVVKMPVLWRDEWFADLALATGATAVDPIAGLPLKSLTVEHLGRVDNLLITKDDTHLDGIQDLTNHISTLKAEGSDESLIRASRLNTKTARYFVGAHSDSALSYRRLKVEDAISSAWQALNGGIVAGGGVALMNAARNLIDGPMDGTPGMIILHKALAAPFYQILANSGISKETSPGQYGNAGVDTRTGQRVDMFEAGIVDPANIVLNAVRNAISVAAAILTASTVVTFPEVGEKLM